MSQLTKLWSKVKNNPKTVSFSEADKLLTKAGFTRRQSKHGSSHYTYTKDDKRTTIPKNRPYILEAYVKQMIEVIGDAFEED